MLILQHMHIRHRETNPIPSLLTCCSPLALVNRIAQPHDWPRSPPLETHGSSKHMARPDCSFKDTYLLSVTRPSLITSSHVALSLRPRGKWHSVDGAACGSVCGHVTLRQMDLTPHPLAYPRTSLRNKEANDVVTDVPWPRPASAWPSGLGAPSWRASTTPPLRSRFPPVPPPSRPCIRPASCPLEKMILCFSNKFTLNIVLNSFDLWEAPRRGYLSPVCTCFGKTNKG